VTGSRWQPLLPMSAPVRRDGQFRVIDASQLVRGDLVVLRPRDRISADLTLTRSHAARWMSPWVSGESVAVQHAARESGIAGTLADHTRLDPGLVRRADRCKLQGFAWSLPGTHTHVRAQDKQDVVVLGSSGTKCFGSDLRPWAGS
jgi:magnesium-transporting ATPase (P-type)